MKRLKKTLIGNRGIKSLSNRILLLVILISSVFFVINTIRGGSIHFAEWEKSIVVTAYSQNKDYLEAGLNNLVAAEGFSKIDRVNSIVTFQRVNYSVQDLESIVGSDVDIKVKEIYPSNQSIISDSLGTILILTATFIVVLFFYQFRFVKRLQWSTVWMIVSRVVFLNILSFLVYLSLLSLVSTFYQVKVVDVLLMFSSILLVDSFALVALNSIKLFELTNYAEVANAVVTWTYLNTTKFIKYFALILALITWGFGGSFVIPAIIFFVALITEILLIRILFSYKAHEFLQIFYGVISKIKKYFRKSLKRVKASKAFSQKTIVKGEQVGKSGEVTKRMKKEKKKKNKKKNKK